MRNGPTGDETIFAIERSAAPTMDVASDVALFDDTRSAVVELTEAVFVIVPAAVGVTVIVTDALPPEAMLARVQVTTPPDALHPADADPNVTPAGRLSVTVGATAVEGPPFVTVKV